MKIVINACYGGFSVSDTALRRYAERKGLTLYPETEDGFTTYWIVPPDQRTGILPVEDIPVGALYRIRDYDGFESIELRDEIKWEIAK